MESENVTIKYVHWKSGGGGTRAILLWSDGTWEEKIFSKDRFIRVDGKNERVKNYIKIDYCIRKRFTKEKTLRFIENKIKYVEWLKGGCKDDI